MNLTNFLSILLLTVTLMATDAHSQPERRGDPERMAELLELTDDQRAELAALREDCSARSCREQFMAILTDEQKAKLAERARGRSQRDGS